MQIKTQSTEKSIEKQVKMRKPEMNIVLFDTTDIVATSSGCLSAGTIISMANGTFKNIEDIHVGDSVMAFDHESGDFTESEVMYVYRSAAPKCAFTAQFSNGTELSIFGEHDLFEQESNRYVTITEENAEQLIGHNYFSAADNSYVELVGITRETVPTDYFELYTEDTINTVANGMLNAADDVDFLLNLYEFNDDLKANTETLSQDVQQYGLLPFSEEYQFTREEYEDWNMEYLNIAVGKGLISWEEVYSQHEKYLEERDDNA